MNPRLDKLRARLDELGLDAMVVSHNADQRYLTGFSGHADYDSVILVSRDDARVITDFRYWEVAEKQAPALKLVKRLRGEYELGDALRDFAQENNLRLVGFDAQHVNVYQFKDWKKGLAKAGAKLKATEDVVKAMRATKDDDEVDKIRRAVKLTDDTFSHLLGQIRAGMTEKQVAWTIESYMREHGAERMAFDPIVASGPNAALPHAEPTDRALQEGEPITIDMGSQVDGYNSDMTRTITLGHATEKFNEVYRTVLKAQQAVEKKARVGMTGKQVDKLARGVIDRAGYANEFGHGLGHGVGRVVHEFPRAGKSFKKDIIEPNMVLTVEPGIYIPGWGGVRIEDMVVFRPDRLEILTQSTKDPLVKLNR
jgi:Xaa-Pro aminopeptidase